MVDVFVVKATQKVILKLDTTDAKKASFGGNHCTELLMAKPDLKGVNLYKKNRIE